MTLTIWHVIGILATLAVIVGVSVYSGRSVKSAADFDRGGNSGPWLVAGAIMGALVSGQATVGTAQLAYSYGLAAWWFTLGAGIGCLLLAVGYVVPLRHSGSTTLLGIVSQRYGKAAGYWGSVLCSLGIFISVIAQVISATALLTTIFPMGMGAAALVSVAIMTLYVVFGGVTGAGMGGVVKLFLLYLACIVGSLTVWSLSGGVTPLLGRVSDLCQAPGMDAVLGLSGGSDAFHTRFLSLVARGPLKDVGSGISLLLGVLSTQTYAQAIWSARSDSAARKGALLSALLIPPIGIACILIGLYMRAHYITTAEVQALAALGQAVPPGLTEMASTSQAFPMFVVNHLPSLVGGVVLGTLFITIVGGGSGLSMGVASILVNDIFKRLSRRLDDPKTGLVVTRITIIVVLLCAALIAVSVPGPVINDFGFLSMGLRGAVVFVPMTFALFCKAPISEKLVLCSVIGGPLAVLLGSLLSLPFDSLFLGMAVSLLCCAAGAHFGKTA